VKLTELSFNTLFKTINNMENTYQKYAIIVAKIDALEAEKEALRVTILTDMVKNGQEKIETDVGKFSRSSKKTWEYPETVKQIGEDFKAAKAKAESTGEATFTETESIRFTGIKL
jgi:hypothetical protein